MAQITILVEDEKMGERYVLRKEKIVKSLNNGQQIIDAFEVLVDIMNGAEVRLKEIKREQNYLRAKNLLENENMRYSSGKTYKQSHLDEKEPCTKGIKCLYKQWLDGDIDSQNVIGHILLK